MRIVRDKWGVPHITAKQRADVMYGAGFAAAEDRQLLLELAAARAASPCSTPRASTRSA